MVQSDTYLVPNLPTTIFKENDWKKEQSLIAHLLPKVKVLTKTFMEIGDGSAREIENLSNLSNPLIFKHYWIIHEWTTYVKRFLILCRDSFLEQEKGRVLLRDKHLTQEALEKHQKEVLIIIQQAFEEVCEVFQTTKKSFDKRQLREWKAQKNPWAIYRKQLTLLVEQCEELEKQTTNLFIIQDNFQRVRELIDENITTCKTDINSYDQSLTKVLEMIKATGKNSDLAALQPKVEEINRTINLTHYYQSFSLTLENHLLQLKAQLQIILGSEEGLLSVMDIPIRKRTEQWLGTEIEPLLYEIWELTEDMVNGTKMALVNVRNQLILVQNQLIDGKEVDRASVGVAVSIFQKKISRTKSSIEQLEKLVWKRMNEFFVVSLLYKNANHFLPIRLQDTIQPFKFKRHRVLKWLLNLIRKQTNVVDKFRRYVKQEEALSVSEKVVRYIKSKRQYENDYTAIFLTKGHIGESFWVGRSAEIRRMQSLIKDWESGFRGTVLITGKRLAGKSLFGELISHRYFLNETINLFSDTSLQIDDKQLNHNHDLKLALQFIKKQKKTQKLLIWIDDLELWFSKKITLSENIRELKKFIHNNDDNYFFMISMGVWLKNHLQQFHGIDKLFQAEIKLGPMSVAEINEAILIRHNATHKTLINEKGERIAPKYFKQLTAQISKSAHGNIGEALNNWGYSMQMIDSLTVRNRFNAIFTLPDFINTEIGMVLSAFILQKQTNEEQLRKLFGSAYTKNYSGIVKRLLGVGILKKSINGDLTINEIIVNQIAQMLTKRGIFDRIN